MSAPSPTGTAAASSCSIACRPARSAPASVTRAALAAGIGLASLLVPFQPLRAQSLDPIDHVVTLGISRRVYPGAVVIVGRSDTLLLARGYGHLTWSSASPVPSADSTLWDVASLTKVVVTTGIAARLVDRGLLNLDAPVSTYLPAFTGGERPQVTVRMLLNHTSGLPAWISLAKETSAPSEAIVRICAEPLRHSPGTVAEYSDLNAILLGAILEIVGGAPLEVLAQREVFGPLGMTHSSFLLPPAARPLAAPTTSDAAIRQGVVNDPNAFYLGGVAGHAGLFSTGPDLARVARVWLGLGTLEGVAWVSPGTIRRFLEPSPSSGSRLLGWDTPDTTMVDPSSFGRHPDPGTYGHTGWTGTQMWIDPARDVYVVFLTNRAYEPQVKETFQGLRRIRTALADAVISAVPCRPVAAAEC